MIFTMFCGQSTASNLATMISFLACAFKVDYQGTLKIPLGTEVSQQDNTQDSWRRKWLLCLDENLQPQYSNFLVHWVSRD